MERTSLIFKSLLSFLTFGNYESPYLAEGFFATFVCFGIAFSQLGVVPRTRNKLDVIVAVTECCLITNHQGFGREKVENHADLRLRSIVFSFESGHL